MPLMNGVGKPGGLGGKKQIQYLNVSTLLHNYQKEKPDNIF